MDETSDTCFELCLNIKKVHQVLIVSKTYSPWSYCCDCFLGFFWGGVYPIWWGWILMLWWKANNPKKTQKKPRMLLACYLSFVRLLWVTVLLQASCIKAVLPVVEFVMREWMQRERAGSQVGTKQPLYCGNSQSARGRPANIAWLVHI